MGVRAVRTVSVVQAARAVGVRRQGVYVRQGLYIVEGNGTRERRIGAERMVRKRGRSRIR